MKRQAAKLTQTRLAPQLQAQSYWNGQVNNLKVSFETVIRSSKDCANSDR